MIEDNALHDEHRLNMECYSLTEDYALLTLTLSARISSPDWMHGYRLFACIIRQRKCESAQFKTM